MESMGGFGVITASQLGVSLKENTNKAPTFWPGLYLYSKQEIVLNNRLYEKRKDHKNAIYFKNHQKRLFYQKNYRYRGNAGKLQIQVRHL